MAEQLAMFDVSPAKTQATISKKLEANSGEMLRTYHVAHCGHSDVYGAGCRQFIYPHHAKLIVGDSERLNT